MRRKITSVIKDYCFKKNGLHTKSDLDVVPLALYEIMIEMDWMESHHVILDSDNKIITSQDEDGSANDIKGIVK